MNKSRLVLIAIVYVATVGLYGAIFSTTLVSAADPVATPIPNVNLKTLSAAQRYLWNNNQGYLTYIKGASILYRENAGSVWKVATDSSNIASLANRGVGYEEQTGCVNLAQTVYKFKARFRSNYSGYNGGSCGTKDAKRNSDLVYSGGRILVDPPDGVPTAIFIIDIDSANADWQRIYFTKSALTFVYKPSSGAKFDYSNTASDGKLSTSGNGVCNNVTDERCNALVLLSANSFHAKVMMKSDKGLMDINNDITQLYQTLTFDPNGGCVTDNGGDGLLIRSYTSGCVVLRDYVQGQTAAAFPTPSREGYKFDYWYTAGGLVVSSQLMSVTDVTLYAHWTPIPTWKMSGYTAVSPGSRIAVPGQQITFTHHVVNDGPDATDQDILSATEVSGGGTAIGDHTTCSGTYGCAYGPKEDKVTSIDVITVPIGTPAGHKYCQNVGYKWLAYNDSARGTGEIVCVLVVASPYVSVVGGNTWAGGSADASGGYTGIANISAAAPGGVVGDQFGSFGEYGVFATGSIGLFGSSGRLNNSASPGMRNGTRLTFANENALGLFTNTHKIPNLISHYDGVESTVPSVMSGSTVSASGIYRAVGDITISGMSPGNEKAIIYAPENTVTISGNIVYAPSGVTSFKDLPSLTVVAKDIVVQGNVTEIAGNFYASNSFVTCKEGPRVMGASSEITTTGACRFQLVINGTVTVTNQAVNALVFNRSYGGTSASQPSEMIRMRPESVLTPAGNSLILTTVFESELPPRY